jgi:hypothetical protein
MRLARCSTALPDSVPAALKARRVGETLGAQTHRRGCHQASSRRGLRVGQPRLGTEQPCHQPATARHHRPDAGMPECLVPTPQSYPINRRPYRSRQTKHPSRRTLILSMSSAHARTAVCVRQAAPLIHGAHTIITTEATFLLADVGGNAGRSQVEVGMIGHGAAFMRLKDILYWFKASQARPEPSAERCTGIL